MNLKFSKSIFDRQRIAIISDHGDPSKETGVEEAGGQNVYVRQLGEILPTFGWQVDIFTRKIAAEDRAIVQNSPYCRTIRLVAGPDKFQAGRHDLRCCESDDGIESVWGFGGNVISCRY